MIVSDAFGGMPPPLCAVTRAAKAALHNALQIYESCSMFARFQLKIYALIQYVLGE